MVADEAVELLFERGALSTFDARINIAYAFSLISKQHRDDFRLIKEIRNAFAHAPRSLSLSRPDLHEKITKLSYWQLTQSADSPGVDKSERFVYLLTIGMFVVFAHKEHLKRKATAAAAADTAPKPIS